ncbi:MAG: GAF domain-containing protein [Acidobacteriota bacterium]
MASEPRGEASSDPAILDLVVALARASAEGDVEVVARCLASALKRVVPFQRGYLMTLEGQRGRLAPLDAVARAASRPAPPPPVQLPAAYLRRLAAGRRPPFPRVVPLAAGTTVPLVSASAVIGALYLGRRAPFDARERALLDRVAPLVSAHVAVAQRIEGTVSRLYQLALVNAASRRMSANIRSDALVADVVTAIQTTFGFDHVILFQIDHRLEQAREIAYAGKDGPHDAVHRQPLGKGLVGHAARTAEPVVANDVRRDPRYLRGVLHGTRSELAIPLMSTGKVIGVLDLGSGEVGAFDRSTIVILETLASQVANFLRNAEHFERARVAAERLRVLLATSRQMARAVDNENVLPVITDQAKVLLRASHCTVYRLQESGKSLRAAGAAAGPRRTLPVATGVVGRVLAEGTPEIHNDALGDPRVRALAARAEHVMVAPLHSRGLSVGAMVVARRDAPFANEDLDILSIFAGLAADSLRRQELHREIRETKDFPSASSTRAPTRSSRPISKAT